MATLADVFLALNSLEEDGTVRKYAIAGGMAFLFYTEPAITYDLDVFVLIAQQRGTVLSMGPLYSKLRERGYAVDAEHVVIHDTPVQFLPACNSLAEEAMAESLLHEYEGVQVRVVSPEHLIALAYQTGERRRLELGNLESGESFLLRGCASRLRQKYVPNTTSLCR